MLPHAVYTYGHCNMLHFQRNFINNNYGTGTNVFTLNRQCIAVNADINSTWQLGLRRRTGKSKESVLIQSHSSKEGLRDFRVNATGSTVARLCFKVGLILIEHAGRPALGSRRSVSGGADLAWAAQR